MCASMCLCVFASRVCVASGIAGCGYGRGGAVRFITMQIVTSTLHRALLDGRPVFWCLRVLANAARRGRVYDHGGNPLFLCRFARFWFRFFVCGAEFFFARIRAYVPAWAKGRERGSFEP